MSADDPSRPVPVEETDDGTLEIQSVPSPTEPPPAESDTGPGPDAAPPTFIGPRAGKRRGVESVFVRLVATSGIVGISVALAAVLGTQDVAFWIIGLVVSLVSVVLAAILWSSRTL
jgi:hypothetical protein